MARRPRYQPTVLAQDILGAIDAGARDVYDINVHVVETWEARGDVLYELRDFTATINDLRHKGRLIEPTRSPRHEHRSAYQRAQF